MSNEIKSASDHTGSHPNLKPGQMSLAQLFFTPPGAPAPLTTVRELWLTTLDGGPLSDHGEIADYFYGALTLGLQLQVRNFVDEDEQRFLHLIVMSGEQTVSSLDSVWGDNPTAERILLEEGEFHKLLADPRWETHSARAAWVWQEDSGGNDPEAWAVVEFLDQPIEKREL